MMEIMMYAALFLIKSFHTRHMTNYMYIPFCLIDGKNEGIFYSVCCYKKFFLSYLLRNIFPPIYFWDDWGLPQIEELVNNAYWNIGNQHFVV